MEQISVLYKKEMARDLRGETSMRVRLGLIDLDAATTITGLTGSAPAAFSRIASTTQENAVPVRVYATFEPARMRLDGSQIIMPAENPCAEGYVSAALAGADGTFAQPPVIDIAFFKTHKVAALTFTFDRAGGGWPSLFRIEAWRGTQKLLTENAAPTTAEFVSGSSITNFDRLRLTFLRSAKLFQRARLQQIMFGVGLVMDGTTLQTLTRTEEVDPLSRRLPVGKFSFSIDNTDAKYNPDDPSKIWDLMELQSPIWLQYGQEIREGLRWRDGLGQTWAEAELRTWRAALFGGTVEIVNGGRYYLTSQPTVQNDTASFEAHTILDRMTQPFLLSTWRAGQVQTLYDLAVSVLQSADLPLLDAGQVPWRLWSGLRNLTTAAHLPKTSGASCLQLIAHAARCVLFVDRNGYIRIEPAPQEPQDYALDFEVQTDGPPQVEKTPTVRSVACKRYTYAPANDEPTELHRMTYNVSGAASLFVEFSGASTELTLEVLPPETAEGAPPAVTNVTGTLEPYVFGARINLAGVGEAQVVVRGRSLKASSTAHYYDIPGADEHGSIEHVENPIVTDSAMANALAKWSGMYFARRAAYTCACRGEPALNILDTIQTQSLYDNAFLATVVQTELSFDGTLSGRTIVKRI